ncbi:MAG: sigma-54-dependent transcriptional regulator [Bdellovibrionales bacterium]
MRVFILDDDKSTRRSLQVALEEAGHAVRTSHDPQQAFELLMNEESDVVVFDIRLGEISGLDVFKKLKREGFQTPVIFMSGHASLSEAVEAVNLGAFDFLEKPFAPEKLLISIQRCMEIKELREKLEKYEKLAPSTDFMGGSAAFQKIKRSIGKVAATNTPVLIIGESGTGKELVAREVHVNSRVRGGAFIKVNCSAVPESLFESEFFGHEKGAFTGAALHKKGYFELANNGTLLLDEIGDMPLNCQAKILRALQNAEIQKVGSEKTLPINVRIIASTNRDLAQGVKQGWFREDLFYRLNVYPIESPVLRDRRDDIPVLAKYFLREYCETNGLSMKTISEAALAKLMNYPWPGNIRELKNMIERLAILSGQNIDSEDIPEFLSEPHAAKVSNLSLKDFRKVTEREYIVKILIEVKGNISEAAQRLELERTYLHKKIQDYDIAKKEFFI